MKTKRRNYKIKDRLYIEAKYLEKFGFGIGQAIQYSYNKNNHTIEVLPVGESNKHVAKTTQKTGSIVPVIDIKGEEVKEFFESRSNVQVEIKEGKIIFTVAEEINNVINFKDEKTKREVNYSVSVPELAKVVNADQTTIFDMFRVSESDTKHKKGLGNKLKDKAIKMLSLFSGCGSLDKGFLDEGYDIVFANDRYEKKALRDHHINTYRENIGDHIVMKDVLDITENDIPEVDFLAAGIPCVRFSALNTINNYRDSNSSTHPLVEQTINIVKWSKAKAFLFENVSNFITVKKGAMLNRLREAFPDFQITAQVIDATELGSAQKRKRSFVLGIKGAEPEIKIPHLTALTTVKKAFANIDDAPQQDMYFRPTEKTLERMKHVPQGGNIKNVPTELRAPNKKFSNYCQRLNEDGFSPTITHIQDDVFINPKEDRYLSVREGARLFSLPDDFTFTGSLTAIFEMLKNAVDYKVSRFLAKTIKSQLTPLLY